MIINDIDNIIMMIMMMMIMYKVENGVGVLQITMLLPFKYVNDPNLLKTMKSIFMLDL